MTAVAPHAMSVPLSWRLRASAAVACVIWPPLLEFMSLDRLVRRGARRSANREWASLDVATANALAGRVDRWLSRAPWPWRRTCLRRAIVLQRMLAGEGVDVRLVIGVRKVGGALEAHAWLEMDGRPILERLADDVRTYQVLSRLPELT